MGVILEVIAPVFGLIALGFGAAKLGWFKEDATRGLVRFVFNFAIPALLFRSLVIVELPERIEWGFLLSFYVGSFAVYGVGVAAARLLYRRPPDAQAIFGMSAGFSNTVLVGIPVLFEAYGPEAALPAFLLIALQSPLLLPPTIALIQFGRGEATALGPRLRSVSVDLLSTPIVIGVLAGLAANLVRLSLPSPIDATLELLGTAAVPCALFAMGAAMAACPLRGDLSPALLLITLKLVLHPLIVWLLAGPILGVDGIWLLVAVGMAATPSGINAYLFAARYEAAEGVAARAVVFSTVASVVTISVVLYLLG